MKLVIPHTNFHLQTESDRVIIDTAPNKETDRPLERQEVARRLGRSLRMVDFYRRLTGEARLRSERFKNRTIIRESELARWNQFVKDGGVLNHYIENNDDRSGRFRPRKTRRSSVEKFIGDLSGLTLAKSSTGSRKAH